MSHFVWWVRMMNLTTHLWDLFLILYQNLILHMCIAYKFFWSNLEMLLKVQYDSVAVAHYWRVSWNACVLQGFHLCWCNCNAYMAFNTYNENMVVLAYSWIELPVKSLLSKNDFCPSVAGRRRHEWFYVLKQNEFCSLTIFPGPRLTTFGPSWLSSILPTPHTTPPQFQWRSWESPSSVSSKRPSLASTDFQPERVLRHQSAPHALINLSLAISSFPSSHQHSPRHPTYKTLPRSCPHVACCPLLRCPSQPHSPEHRLHVTSPFPSSAFALVPTCRGRSPSPLRRRSSGQGLEGLFVD